jgi:sigma-B regulation protein RsbU (phosphoserine phosphatase)
VMGSDLRVLVADDSPIFLGMVSMMLGDWGFEVTVCESGTDALKVMSAEDSPSIVLLDWMMPDIDGLEVCRRIRDKETSRYFYIILVTGKTNPDALVEAFDAGVDDFLTKPVEQSELRARLRAGQRIVMLKDEVHKLRELKEAQQRIKWLEDILPVCMHCGKIRDQKQIWHNAETYLKKVAGEHFSHGLCDECLETQYPEQAARILKK